MSGTTKALTWTCLALAFCATLIYMAGLAGLQYGCNTGLVPTTRYPPSVFGMSDTWGNCPAVFRFYWFTFSFLIVFYLAVGIAAATRHGLYRARPFLAGMTTVCIVLVMISCESFAGYENMFRSVEPWGWLSRWRTTLAGAIMTLVWLIGLLMAVGIDWEYNNSAEPAAYHHRDQKVATTTAADRV